jgi:hypothetical protein
MLGLSASGHSTEEDRPVEPSIGLMQRYEKKTSASRQVDHWGRLTGVYANAIEFQRMPFLGAGGYWLTFGLVGGLIGTVAMQWKFSCPGFLSSGPTE